LKVVIDIEANGLRNPTQIWVIVCKDIDTGKHYIFREVTSNANAKEDFLSFAKGVTLWIGHNFLGYDYPNLNRLVGLHIDQVYACSIDTLVVSKLADYSRDEGHSIEAYGVEFGQEKIAFTDFSKYTPEMEEYCVRDCDICHKVYNHHLGYINDPGNKRCIKTEQRFQLITNSLHDDGFGFNISGCLDLLSTVTEELRVLDEQLLKEFPPKEVLIKEFTPKATKFGTINKTSVPRSLWDKIHEYEIGETYRHTKLVPFNPGSPVQIVSVLHEANWRPEVKTKTHAEAERDLNRLKYRRGRDSQVDETIKLLEARLVKLQKKGWKVNEQNLSTLPDDAPAPARTLARRILYESRRKTLTEWKGLYNEKTGRIHGDFYGIGAWTHRMAHQRPNTANIPTEHKLFGKEMRTLWRAPKRRLLVGVDADSIQFRIAAHYIGDPALIKKIVDGKKSDKTDPHSYNMKVIGDFCPSRDASKRTLFSLILGGGPKKFAELNGCTVPQGEQARDNLYQEYPGLVTLKQEIVVEDAKRGYFIGLDGRKVIVPDATISGRKHLMPSGYLQNGEAVIMKMACILWHDDPEMRELFKEYRWFLVDFVHDEWQTEVPNKMEIALRIAKKQADSLRIVGEELGLKCPLAGSYWNEDAKDYTIGTTWAVTH